jgi:hypothetical protein
VSSIVEDSGRRLLMTGALTWDFTGPGRAVPYVTVGAGIDRAPDATPTATIDAGYQFQLTLIPAVIRETEVVTIRFDHASAPVFLFGGGCRWAISRHSAIRADARVHMGPNTSRVLIDTRVESVRLEGPETGLLIGGSPSLVFSGTPTVPTSLSGPALDGFEVFSAGHGRAQVTIAVGYSRRF